ncbi:MAG TPA: RNA polymerase sigma factor [Gemmataceae bacterium]|nr:RNA polymerase sigma factor [Gemmataceae bacterium]
MSDADLVRQTLSGQTLAYEELVRRWAGRVTALCHAKIGRTDGIDDLVQETLLRGYRSISTLADPNKFGSWLCGIAVRICLDSIKAKVRTHIPFSALGPEQNPESYLASAPDDDGQSLDQADELRHLMAQVEALPEEYREVLMLYYYDDLTYRDLAEMLDVSSATVNARLTKARALLRQRMTPKVRR